jgi:hypothetical protein
VQQDRSTYSNLFAADSPAADAVQREQAVRQMLLNPKLAAVHDQPVAHDVLCRQHLCSIRAVFPAGADSEEWSTYMLIALAGDFTNSRILTQKTPDGETELTVYAARKGAEALLLEPAAKP